MSRAPPGGLESNFTRGTVSGSGHVDRAANHADASRGTRGVRRTRFASLYFSRMSIPVWKNAQKEKKRNRSDVSDPNEPAIDSIHGSDAVGARDEERNLRERDATRGGSNDPCMHIWALPRLYDRTLHGEARHAPRVASLPTASPTRETSTRVESRASRRALKRVSRKTKSRRRGGFDSSREVPVPPLGGGSYKKMRAPSSVRVHPRVVHVAVHRRSASSPPRHRRFA